MALDLSAQTPPTPRTTPRSKSAGSTPKSAEKAQAAKHGERAEGIKGVFQLAAFGCIMFGGQTGLADAGACATHGEPIANEAATLAESNKYIAAGVDFVIGVGPFAALLATLAPFGLQILLNHGRIPNVPALAQFGVVPPELMQQRAELDQQRQQAELMAAMREQQEELARLQHEAQREANAA